MKRTPAALFRAVEPWLYLLPTVIGLLLFSAGAVAVSFLMSFTHWDIITPPEWIWLENYLALWGSDLFWEVVRNTVVFVLMAVLYGALNAALDTTAGERERGSLEPLLMNPAPRLALVLGKWGAVASVGILIAVLSCLSFLPGQWLLRSESLSALFRFGIGEAATFVGLLLPLAGALAAVLMAVAIRCKSFKEAQANATIVLLGVSLLPLVTIFNQEGQAPWHLWVPALAQTTLMSRVLRGDALPWADVALAAGVCVLLAALAIGFVARTLRTAALK